MQRNGLRILKSLMMADNYLEKKMEEFKSRPWSASGNKTHKPTTTLNKLLIKNRQYEKFDNNVIVREEHLKKITDVCSKIDFIGGTKPEEFTFKHIVPVNPADEEMSVTDANMPKMELWENSICGGCKEKAAPCINSATNARAFIIIEYKACIENSVNENILFLNLGILMQSMHLRATEMGLNGQCIYLAQSPSSADPLMAVVAVGKGMQSVQ